MLRRTLFLPILALALLGTVLCDEEDGGYDPEGGMPYGDDEGGDDMMGGGGEDEGGGYEPPPGDVTTLETVADLEAFIDNEDASIVAAFTASEVTDPDASLPDGWDAEEDGEWVAPTIENPALTTFKAVSTNVYGYRYASTSSPEVLEQLKSKAGGLYLFRSPKFLSTEHGDRPRERFPSDKWSESAVSNWLKAKAQPLVGLYNSQTSSRYDATSVVIIFMNLDFEQNAKGVQYVLKRARKAAKALKGKIAVAVARLSDMTYELGDYGLESTKPKSDILMGLKAKGKSYAPDAGKAFSGPALTEFAQAFLDGKLTAYERPDPPPPPPYDEGEDAGEFDGDEDMEEDGAGKDEM